MTNPLTITCGDFRHGYVMTCRQLMLIGHELEDSRGNTIKESIGSRILLTNPRDAMPAGVGRDLVPAIGIAEAAQLIGGISYPEVMKKIAAKFGEFMDGGTFHGAYGIRTRNQLPEIIQLLKRDPQTRQAVMTIWDPAHDQHADVKDIPCTISLQFLIREGKLHMIVYMRSNDVWLGLPYDIFQFTQLQITMATLLARDVGTYTHSVGSLHAYKQNWSGIEKLNWPVRDTYYDSDNVNIYADGFASIHDENLADTQRFCRDLMDDPTPDAEYGPGSKQDYADIMSQFNA